MDGFSREARQNRTRPRTRSRRDGVELVIERADSVARPNLGSANVLA